MSKYLIILLFKFSNISDNFGNNYVIYLNGKPTTVKFRHILI